MQSTLNSLQDRVLGAVATVGGWTLAVGGALAGVYLGHRTTEDLDLFLVNELGVLLPRSELRDLEDVRALVANRGRSGPSHSRRFAQGRWVLADDVRLGDRTARSVEAAALGFDGTALAEFRDWLLRWLAAELQA